MKRISLLLLLTIISFAGIAQTMTVKDFHLLERDLTANTEGTRRISPQDGNVAALIKVVTTERGFNFDGGAYSVVGSPAYQPGEIWIYVPARSQKITISHPRFGVLRDYYFPIPIEAARTYEMLLDPGVGKYVTIQTQTPRSTVYLDSDSIGEAPIYNLYVLYGQHKLHAFNDKMEGELTLNVVKDGNDAVEVVSIPMTNQSDHFGNVTIKTDRDAEIILNGVVKGIGTWNGDLREGDYVVETRKQNCDNVKTSFKVEPRKHLNVNAEPPIPHTGIINIFSRPRNVQISVNGKSQQSSENIMVPVGIQTLNFSHKGYHSQTKEYDITQNQILNDTIELNRIQYLKQNGIYLGAAASIGEMFGVTAFAGATYRNIDLQLSYTFGLSKTNPVYFYTAEDNTFRSKTEYRISSISIKAGYQFRVASKFGLFPQLGYVCNFLQGKTLEGSEVPGDGAMCNCISMGGKVIFTPFQHFCLFAQVEYDLAVSSSTIYTSIAQTAGFSRGGFLGNVGLMVTF